MLSWGTSTPELDPEGEMVTPGVTCVVRMVTESQTMLEESYWLSWRPTWLLCVTPGLGKRTYTSKHGSIPNQSGGTVSTSPSCGKVTAKGAWMLL